MVSQAPSKFTVATHDGLRRILEAGPSAEGLEQALRHLAKWRSEVVANTVQARSGGVVISGPFKGMAYGVRAAEGSRAARLIGCYEASLAPVIEEIVAAGYAQVIDVGSAEGYYAVGLALRMPQARVMARDENPVAMRLCRDLALANNVADRVEIGGRLDHAGFDICARAKTLVVCDIEGAEGDLLDPVKAPGLAQADVLVEAHECITPGLTRLIARRFQATHQVRVIGRHVDDSGFPEWMEGLSDMDRLLALWEWRTGPTPWLWMVKK